MSGNQGPPRTRTRRSHRRLTTPRRPRVAHKVISGPSPPLPTPEIVCETISSGITAPDDAVAGCWSVIESPPNRTGTNKEAEVVLNDLAGLSAGANYQKARF